MIDAEQYGPWAVIAGASEGIGTSFAHKLGKAGLNLVLIARNEELLGKVADEVRDECGVQVRVLALDLGRADMLERVREMTADVDVGLVIYNAAAGSGRFLEVPLDDALLAVRVNTIGPLSLVHHFGRGMAERGRGGIILIGSLAGNAGGVTTVVYSASKAFAQIFAEGLWSDLKPQGVDVLYVVVGATNTPKRARLGLKDSPDEIVAEPDEVAQDALDHIADGPVFVPEHLAEGFRYFSSLPRREAAEAMAGLLLGYADSFTAD